MHSRNLGCTFVGAAIAISLAGSTFVGAAATISSAGSRLATQADPDAGPPCKFQTELKGGGAVPLKDAAIITREDCGYRYRAGQQNSHLVVNRVKAGLRFADRHTKRFKRLAPACHEKRGVVGVAAVCKVPGKYSARRPLLIEVWPRLGDDFVDGSSLPVTFAMAVLGDAGNDVVHLGAGPDFFNGAFDRDRVWGGAGNDWLRTGDGRDHIRGAAGNDFIVAGDGPDTIIGGKGDDKIYCGPGKDRAKRDAADSVIRFCERVSGG